jgi:hypothetical protein
MKTNCSINKTLEIVERTPIDPSKTRIQPDDRGGDND